MRTPREVDAAITSRCNLRCTYCYFFDNPEVVYEDLPSESWLRFFEECGRCAVMRIILAGGEPFIREDLGVLLNGIVGSRMRFAVLTNGTLVTDEKADLIARSGRCDYVQVSLDGSRPEVHDACRGEGSFDLAIRGFRTLQRHGIRVTARVTIHRHNVNDLENTARLLLEDLGLSSFSTNAAGYMGSCRQNADAVMLSTRDRQVAMDALLRLDERHPGRVSASAGPLANARVWRRMVEAREREAPPFTEGGRLTGCGCANSRIAVRSDGVMIPCPMLPQMELGQIGSASLARLWRRHPDLNGLRARVSIPLTEFDFCDDCPYIPYCTGNCPGIAYNTTGKVDHPSPDSCLRRFLADGGTIPSMPAGSASSA
jgi:SynChlorMet cassette radical SAM/SPASM protein ScmE